ncbi:protein FAM136A [Cynoglossus semilaevis]|nr:protein FAM136A [Cynoglossus semilaevis]
MEASQERMQKMIEDMVNSLDKDYIRNMQRDMFRCSAKCFDRPTDSTGQIRECVERCQRPVVKAEQTVTEELDAFQNRLRRCTMQCSDKAKDLMDDGKNKSAAESLFNSCQATCLDDHVNLIPSMTRRIHENLQSFQQL